MPIYEFRCENCGTFEKQRSMSEASAPMLCPNCQTTAKRIYSVAGLMMPSALSSRIEKSAEPRVVQKSEVKKCENHHHHHQHNHNHHQGRPWMIGH